MNQMTVTIYFKDGKQHKRLPCSGFELPDPIGNWFYLLNEEDLPFYGVPRENIDFMEFEYHGNEAVFIEEEAEESGTKH